MLHPWGAGLFIPHTKTSIGVLFEALAYIWERYYISLVQKGYYEIRSKGRCTKQGPKFLEKNLTIDMLVSSNSCFHQLLSYGDSPQQLSCPFLLGLAFWVLGVYKLKEALGVPMGSFDFGSPHCGQVILHQSLFDWLQSLRFMATDEKTFNEFFIGTIKVHLICDKDIFNSQSISCICDEGIHHLK